MFWSLITFRGMWTFSQSLIFNVHKVHMWTFSQKTMKMFKKFTYELFRCLYNTGTMGTYARSHPKFFQYYISKNIQFAKFIWIKREGLCQNQIQLFLLRMKIYKQTKAKKNFGSGVPKNNSERVSITFFIFKVVLPPLFLGTPDPKKNLLTFQVLTFLVVVKKVDSILFLAFFTFWCDFL